jgi:hypothetical protein
MMQPAGRWVSWRHDATCGEVGLRPTLLLRYAAHKGCFVTHCGEVGQRPTLLLRYAGLKSHSLRLEQLQIVLQ